MKSLIKNIDCLVTCKGKDKKSKADMKEAGIIENGYVIIENSIITEVGNGIDYEKHIDKCDVVIDGKGKTVTPGLIDSHTHVVYGGSRENELAMKLNNVSYIDILKSGGGIHSTVNSTRKASAEELTSSSMNRLNTMLEHGTTTVESKSGYGLNFEDEIKMLKVNKVLNDVHPIDIISTYLGAHAVPVEYKNHREDYINLMINKIIPYVAENKLADFIDCFCEEGVFSVEEARRILLAGKEKGLNIKIHVDEIVSIKGAELSAEIKATSAEHLVAASDEGIKKMAEAGVVAVLLPSTSFYLMLNKFARARKMIDEGVPVALATDCNPGTSPTESLQTVMTFACFGMKLLPEEIINAMTINAAYAVGRQNTIGSIEVGKKADLCIFEAKNLNYLVYHFGANAIDKVIKDGNVVVDKGRMIKKC